MVISGLYPYSHLNLCTTLSNPREPPSPTMSIHWYSLGGQSQRGAMSETGQGIQLYNINVFMDPCLSYVNAYIWT